MTFQSNIKIKYEYNVGNIKATCTTEREDRYTYDREWQHYIDKINLIQDRRPNLLFCTSVFLNEYFNNGGLMRSVTILYYSLYNRGIIIEGL